MAESSRKEPSLCRPLKGRHTPPCYDTLVCLHLRVRLFREHRGRKQSSCECQTSSISQNAFLLALQAVRRVPERCRLQHHLLAEALFSIARDGFRVRGARMM